MLYKLKRGWISILVGVSLGLALSAGATALSSSASPAITDERAVSTYWLNRESGLDDLLATPAQIESINRQIRLHSDGNVLDLREQQGTRSKEQILDIIQSCLSGYNPDDLDELYVGERPLTKELFLAAVQNCNLSKLASMQNLCYALALRRTDLRGLPQRQGWYDTPNDVNYDNLQVRAIDPAEPLIILHESADKIYYFVLTACDRGWIAVKDVVQVPHDTFMRYLDPQQRLVVVKPQLRLHLGTQTFLFQMGATLPVHKMLDSDHFVVSLPDLEHGVMVERELTVTTAQGFNLGYLPLCRKQLLKLGFAYLGYDYGWGGQNEGVDCSGLIRNLYRTTGVFLPSNTRFMLKAFPRSYVFNAETDVQQRLEIIKQEAKAGDCLIKDGHVMLYLGSDARGEPLALHALSSYYPQGSQGPKIYLRKVVVSDLLFMTVTNQPFVETLYSIVALR